MTDPLASLDRFPRIALSRLPTPIEPMPNLQAHLGSGALSVKRDDCTDLALGGNKVRQMEFYLGEALRQSADTILITGAVQSNFVRVAAAGARRLGMDCHIQLEDRVASDDPVYRNGGNVLLDRILGATLHRYPQGEDEEGADRNLGAIARQLETEGRRPFVIPLAPGHPPLGALGYVVAAGEIVQQIDDGDLCIDEIVVPSGSGHTHGGLLFGLRVLGCPAAVTGVCVRRDAAAQRDRIAARCREIGALLGVPSPVTDADIHVTDAFLSPGYGRLNEATVQAMATAAHCEGLILDPVYSGRTMAGFLQRAAGGGDRALLFVHTGGTPGLFAYGPQLTAALAGERSPSPGRA